MSEHRVTFLEILYHLIERRFTVIKIVLTAGIITAIFSLIMPKWYTAKVTLLPPSEERSDFGVSSLLKNLPVGGLGLGLGLGTLSDETNLYLALLNSRTVQDLVLERFNLKQRYKVKTMEEARKVLAKNTSIEINEDNTISVSVQVKTPFFSSKRKTEEARILCADIANYYISKMDSVNRLVRSEKARRTRLFLERRYLQNLEDLHRAEEEFKDFQNKYGMIEIEEQTKAIISSLSQLKAMLMVKEVEASVVSLDKNRDHPDVKRVMKEVEELKKKYNELKNKSERDFSLINESDPFIPLGNIPDIGIQYLRLYREVKIQEMVQEFLYPQYEQAKIQEEKDTPTIQVLDPAVPPELKTKPKRVLMVIGSMLAAFFIYVLFLIFSFQLDYLKISDPLKYKKVVAMGGMIKQSFKLFSVGNH
ncbi:MAG: Wzz/FepE/Etk N-terminal domain-containing protein [candidate division KSB1 bacterium]|nr:Wzz/FepE/Etk N-terminal domain-containing protein [candidate division KSB1 bacterium]